MQNQLLLDPQMKTALSSRRYQLDITYFMTGPTQVVVQRTSQSKNK